MGQETGHPPGWEELVRGLQRYVGHLSSFPVSLKPDARAAVDRLVELAKRAMDSSGSGTPATWVRTRVLAAWPSWRPPHLDRRLLSPDTTCLAIRCRNLVEKLDQRAARGWNPFARTSVEDSNTLRDLLNDCRVACQEISAPLPPQLAEHLERAVPLARDVDDRIATLPIDWTPARLARAAAPLGDVWADPPANGSDSFLSLLRRLLEQVLAPNGNRPYALLLRSVLQEAEEELAHAVSMNADRKLFSPEPLDPAKPATYLDRLRALIAVRTAGEESNSWCSLLAQLTYRAAKELAPAFGPGLDPQSLLLPPGYRPDLANTDVKYQRAASPASTVLGIDRFAVPPGRPGVVVSLGPTPSNDLTVLLAPDPAKLAELPTGPWREQLRAVWKAAEHGFWTEPARVSVSRSVPEFSTWLNTPPGQDWFHALATQALTDGKDQNPARLWLHVLQAWAGVVCYPGMDPSTGRLFWPAKTPVCQPGVTFRFDDDPAGMPVVVERFATTPEAARLVVSLGPESGPGGSGRSAAARLWDVVRREPDGLRAIVASVVESATRGDGQITSEILMTILDALLSLHEQQRSANANGPVDHLDPVLAHLREWAAVGGRSILPVDWTFASGAQWPTGSPPGISAKPLFRSQERVGQVFRVRLFGVAEGDEILRPAEVAISAGPAPIRLTELEEAMGVAPAAVADQLREALTALRPAGLGGYLEQSVVDLYTAFWDQHAKWALHDASAAEHFAALLEEALAETFGLRMFRPQEYREYPEGWVRVPVGTRMTTGRVVHVLRPGLVDRDGQLRVPARVEAE